MASAAFVPGHSGGTATDLHRLPYSPEDNTSPGTSLDLQMLRSPAKTFHDPLADKEFSIFEQFCSRL